MSKLVSLSTWAAMTYGEDAPHMATLLRWAKSGRISPAPVKHGRAYFVSPDAVYTDGDPIPATAGSESPKVTLGEVGEKADPHCPLYIEMTSRMAGVTFGGLLQDFEPLTPHEWLDKNKRRIYFDKTALRLAKSPYEEDLPPMSEGIYFLFAGDELGYVGKSTCIRRRLLQHAQPAGIFTTTAPWFDSWSAIWVPQMFLDTVERHYIQTFRPRHNIALKPHKV